MIILGENQIICVPSAEYIGESVTLNAPSQQRAKQEQAYNSREHVPEQPLVFVFTFFCFACATFFLHAFEEYGSPAALCRI